MKRKTKLSEAQFFALLERALAEADEPLAEIDFDAEEFNVNIDVDDLPPLPAYAPGKPVGAAANVRPLAGTRPISIRLPAHLIHAFRVQAGKVGGGYQTLMNRVLREAASGFV